LKQKLASYYNALSENNAISEEDASFVREALGEDFSRGLSLHKVILGGQRFIFCDLINSDTVRMVANEIGCDSYDFSSINFKDRNVVIDIGGNVGMFSIFLAKKFPFLKISAFQPVKEKI
jgi:hypothetical protein